MSCLFYLRDNKNIHLRNDGTFTRGNPVLCLMTEINKDTNETKYAYCVAHPVDGFEKKLARHIVLERFNKRPHIVNEVGSNKFETNKMVMTDIFNNEETSCRVRSMVRSWLDGTSNDREQVLSFRKMRNALLLKLMNNVTTRNKFNQIADFLNSDLGTVVLNTAAGYFGEQNIE